MQKIQKLNLILVILPKNKNLGIASHINKKKQKKWHVEKKGLHPAVGENLAKWEQSENLS
jgi:hypothetical protein